MNSKSGMLFAIVLSAMFVMSAFAVALPLLVEQRSISDHDAKATARPRDTTPPVTSVKVTGTEGSSYWYLTPITIELVATDAGSGVQYTMYNLNSGAWATYSGPLNYQNMGGPWYLYYYSVDWRGNTEAVKSFRFAIDWTMPSTPQVSTAPPANTWTNWPTFTCGWTQSTDTGSGLYIYYYSFNQDPTSTYFIDYVVPSQNLVAYSPELPDGISYFHLFVEDIAGNLLATHTPLKVDRTVPVTAASLSGIGGPTVFSSNVLVTLTGTDISGIKQIWYSQDNIHWFDYYAFGGPFTVTGVGNHTVWYYSIDNAGNREYIIKTTSFEITAPSFVTLTIKTPPGCPTPMAGTMNVGEGTDVTVYVVASYDYLKYHYEFSRWKLDTTDWYSTAMSVVVHMDKSHTIEAKFIRTFL